MNPTTDRLDAPTDDDPRLVRAAQEYLAALEAGRRPERAAFVARFPGLAVQLAPYLEALDMVHGASPLSSLPSARPAADERLPVEALGDFHIVREIGRGGMGVVYEAVQLSLGRRVALKILPFAAALDARQLQRFKNEAQAAAQLHHQNIVPVYAIGCERGTHYYAMQLIEGQDLAGLIHQMRSAEKAGQGDKGTRGQGEPTALHLRPQEQGPETLLVSSPAPCPPVPLSPCPPASPCPPTAPCPPAAELSTQHSARSARFYRTAAQLAAQTADALEHAHQFDVIHRDIKPANLIVDERGNVWVTDFGLAQFHTSQGLTRTGDLMGTLRYMSPEQAAGRHALLDARTDVYSLGATLYELLTLRPMFDGADAPRLLHQIMHDEPRRPRSVNRSIPPELETIVLKAVGKNPGDRYATARDFADDLRRYLDHRPILARPPGLGQRARKWARRHPSFVVAAVVLCVLTTAGSLLSAWMLHKEQQKTLQRAVQAEQALQLARQSADEMIQISDEELANRPGMEELQKRMLMSALVYYQGLIAQSGDDTDARKQLEPTQARVQKILADLAVLQGGNRLDLLNRGDVKEDRALALNGEQSARLDELHQSVDRERQAGFADFIRLSAEEKQQRVLDDTRAHETAFSEILTPAQQQRLKQIALQLKGLSAFHDADVVADLKLTPEQKQNLRNVEADASSPGPDPRRGPGDPGKGPEHGYQASIKKFVAALTDDQKRRWKDMTGEPFKGHMGPNGPPPHGPDRRGPPPDGPPRNDHDPHGPPPGPPSAGK